MIPWARDDPYAAETARDVGRRAPAGIAFFFGCVVLSAVFDIARFPERAPWMLGFAAAFFALGGLCLVLLRARPAASVPILIGFVNLVGVGLNAYHALVAATVAMCLWTLTGLLGSAPVFLRWGATNQALAAIGSLALFPLHWWLGNVDGLTWAAGGTYLLLMAVMSVFGAGLYADYVRSGLQLTRTLSEREARLQSYFDLAPVGCAVLHPDGRFLEVNDALAAMLGSTREALLAGNWFALPVAADRDGVRAQAEAALSRPGEGTRHEARFVRRDGTVIDATVDVRGLPGPRGTIDHLMVLIQDVTARKRADAEREQLLSGELQARRDAEEASRAKDRFLATLSHELRTPLSPIMTWADLLRRRRMAPADADRGLGAISRNAAALSRLIDELLDVSRIVSGKLRLELSPLDVGPVVLEAVDVVRAGAEAKGVALETEVDPEGCCVLADADRLRQILWNLLANAVKFTPRGGRVRIAVASDRDDARIVVEDTGQGIDPAFLPFVFERFRQGDTTSTRRHGGLGIGLAIVREMVELHGGRVEVESRGEGHGSRFTVALPLLDGDRPVDRAGSAPSSATTLDGVRVLVVDDDLDSNDAVRSVLVAFGAEVRTADSAGEAFAMIDRWTPDVIVSDIAMPGEDGYALLARMRAGGAALRTIPTIALTAFSSARDRDQALSAGFHAHVPKPLRPPDLLHAVVVARESRYRGVC